MRRAENLGLGAAATPAQVEPRPGTQANALAQAQVVGLYGG